MTKLSDDAPRLSRAAEMDYAHLLSRCCLNRVEVVMGDQLPLVRQWILLRKLCSFHHGVTVQEMVQEFGVSEKTIRRDLETFQNGGLPVTRNRWRFWLQKVAY